MAALQAPLESRHDNSNKHDRQVGSRPAEGGYFQMGGVWANLLFLFDIHNSQIIKDIFQHVLFFLA